MYPRHVPRDLLRMIAAGTLDLKAIKTHIFPLDSINEAISKATTLRRLEYSVIVPNSNSTKEKNYATGCNWFRAHGR